MGVWGVRFFRTLLPLVTISLVLISASFTMFAGLKRDTFLDNNYLLKINATNFVENGDFHRNQGPTPANSIGLANYYYVYLWNHCESNNKMRFFYCSKPRFDYYFNSVRLLKARLKRDAKVKIPSGSKSYHKRLRVTSYSSLILLGLGIAFSLATFIFVFIITLSGSSGIFTSVLSCFSTFFLIVGSGLVVGQYMELSSLIRDKASYLRISSKWGSRSFTFLFISSFFSLLSSISLLLATRLIRDKKRAAAKLYN